MTPATDLVNRFVDYIIDPAILVIFTLGFFLFVWGLVQFLWNLDEGGENQAGKSHMFWGIIGMLIMISVFGILNIIDNTLGLNAANPDVNRINNVTAPPLFYGQ